jgi:ribosomal protein L32
MTEGETTQDTRNTAAHCPTCDPYSCEHHDCPENIYYEEDA